MRRSLRIITAGLVAGSLVVLALSGVPAAATAEIKDVFVRNDDANPVPVALADNAIVLSSAGNEVRSADATVVVGDHLVDTTTDVGTMNATPSMSVSAYRQVRVNINVAGGCSGPVRAVISGGSAGTTFDTPLDDFEFACSDQPTRLIELPGLFMQVHIGGGGTSGIAEVAVLGRRN